MKNTVKQYKIINKKLDFLLKKEITSVIISMYAYSIPKLID